MSSEKGPAPAPAPSDIPAPGSKIDAGEHYLAQARKFAKLAGSLKEQLAVVSTRLAQRDTEVKTFKWRSRFEKIAAESGVHPDAVDDAFAALALNIEAEEPDEGGMRAAIGKLKQTKKYFFGKASPAPEEGQEEEPQEERPAPKPAANPNFKPAPGGKPPTGSPPPGTGRIRSADLRDPAFVASRSNKEILDLLKQGIED